MCCSSTEYYQQACKIAESVPKIDETQAEDIQWLPLGVFAVIKDGQRDENLLLQLAVSKEGIIAGTLFDESDDSARPVEGTVDKDTQRAVWTFTDGTSSDMVMETGIYNLTKNETTMLVHFGPEKTQTWTLVRLDEPAGDDVPEKNVLDPSGS